MSEIRLGSNRGREAWPMKKSKFAFALQQAAGGIQVAEMGIDREC
jgi:hypothetical protein